MIATSIMQFIQSQNILKLKLIMNVSLLHFVDARNPAFNIDIDHFVSQKVLVNERHIDSVPNYYSKLEPEQSMEFDC